MGLIKQCDEQMGVLFGWLEETDRMEDTMIVVTSDHGDYLGDHWLGEKTFCHDTSVRVPMIVYDPSSEADATRGTSSDALVQLIDLAPTFVEVAGGKMADLDHILEGKSLLPLLHGKDQVREFSFCEYDFSMTPLSKKLDLDTNEARLFMVTDARYKLIEFGGGIRPMLFDLQDDPDELIDLGESADHAAVVARLSNALCKWARRPAQRTTITNETLRQTRSQRSTKGIVLGAYGVGDADADLTEKFRNRTAPPIQKS
jgi:arylsulfatase A-like enzyme